MKNDDLVVYLPDPWLYGIGTITSTHAQGWLWVRFSGGHYDLFDPQHLELASLWEHQQVEHDLTAPA